MARTSYGDCLKRMATLGRDPYPCPPPVGETTTVGSPAWDRTGGFVTPSPTILASETHKDRNGREEKPR